MKKRKRAIARGLKWLGQSRVKEIESCSNCLDELWNDLKARVEAAHFRLGTASTLARFALVGGALSPVAGAFARGVADRFVVPGKRSNAGGGKGSDFGCAVEATNSQGIDRKV
jgi:hypothetical protein